MSGSISSIGDVRNKKVLDAWWQSLLRNVVEGATRMNERWAIGVIQVFYGNLIQKAHFKLYAVSVKPTIRRTTLGDTILCFHDMTHVMHVSQGGTDNQAHIEVENVDLSQCQPVFEVRLSDARVPGATLDASQCLQELHETMAQWHSGQRVNEGSEVFYGIYGVVSALVQDGFRLARRMPDLKPNHETYWFELVQEGRQLTFTIHMSTLLAAKQRLEAKFLALGLADA